MRRTVRAWALVDCDGNIPFVGDGSAFRALIFNTRDELRRSAHAGYEWMRRTCRTTRVTITYSTGKPPRRARR